MITIELDETPSGKSTTILSGLDVEKYDLNRVKQALKKITRCQKTKLTDAGDIILLGSHVRKVNEFVSRIGF